MKDRQFMTVLALVVGAGLMLGLIASRVTGSAPARGVATAANAAAANPNAPRPSAADEVPDQPADTVPQSIGTRAGNEPTVPATEPPQMQGPGNGDPPGTAAAEPAQPGAPSATPDATPQ